MEFVHVRELSQKFQISVQTVYNYLEKYKGKIRTKREFGKKYVCLEDFTNFVQPTLQSFTNSIENTHHNSPSPDFEKLKNDFWKLETEYKIVAQKTEDLSKHNLNLQDQLSKYAILLTEEKAEKKEILVKYDTIQKEYNVKVESLFREKSLFEKRYYLVLGFLVVLLIFLARTILLPKQ